MKYLNLYYACNMTDW